MSLSLIEKHFVRTFLNEIKRLYFHRLKPLCKEGTVKKKGEHMMMLVLVLVMADSVCG
jgi:hypothetical protein